MGLLSNAISQEIKFLNAFGKPLTENEIVVHGKSSDTLFTNQKGIIKLKKKKKFDSISFIHNDLEIFTKTKNELINNEFIVLLNKGNSLPVFETKTAKHSQVLNALKEINHESIQLEEIYNSNASSAAELLLLSDGVTIQKSQAGGGSPIIRGFEANRILLMVDGVRMNNAIYRGGHLQNSITIDPFIIENCDVIYGSSAVTYGSDAIGGVIHYKTLDPKLSSNNDKRLSGTYFNRFNSATEEFTHHLNFNIGSKKWGAFSSISYKQFGDIKMGEKRNHGDENWGKATHNIINFNGYDSLIKNNNPLIQKGLGYEQLDLNQKVLYKPSKSLSFLINTQLSSSSNIARFDQLNNINNSFPQFSQWDYGPQKRWMSAISIKYNNNFKLFDELSSVFSYQNIEESRITRKFRDTLQENNIENVAVLGANIQALKKLGAFSNITYGAEFYSNVVESNGFSLNIKNGEQSSIDSRYPDDGSNLTMTGLYAVYNLQRDHVSIFGGLRYSINKIIERFENNSLSLLFSEISLQNEALNGSFNLSYYPQKKTKITVDLSTGFRSPNVDDLGKVFTKDTFITVPNNDLFPEYSYSSSLGWVQKISLFNNKIKININNSVYLTYLKNVIVKKPFEINGNEQLYYNNSWYSVVANQNSGNALVYGYGSSLDIAILNKLIIHSGLTLTKGYLTENNSPFGHIPPLIGNLSLKYKEKKYELSFSSIFNGNKKRIDFGPGNVDNPNEANLGGYPNWFTLNSSIRYYISKGLKVKVGCFNILDIHYKTFASGISSPGRSLLISMKLTY